MSESTKRDDNFAPEVRTYLVVRHLTCSPEEITDLLGVAPTRVRRAGQKRDERATITFTHNCWILDSVRQSKSDEVEDQVTTIMEKIGSAVDRFRSLPHGTAVKLFCATYLHGDRPPVHLTAAQVAFLSRIGASVDFDLYDLSETGEPE